MCDEHSKTSDPAVGSTRLVRPPDPPTNLEEWLWYVRRYEDGIYVREQGADGKWGNAKLADLAPERWGQHVARWLNDGVIPCRIKEPEELPNTPAQRPPATDV